MRKNLIVVVVLLSTLWLIQATFRTLSKPAIPEKSIPQREIYKEIKDVVRSGETLFDIFKKYDLSLSDLFDLREASADIYPVRRLHPDRLYSILLDAQDQVRSFTYWVSDDDFLEITRMESGFRAEMMTLPYEKRLVSIGGVIENNLIASMGGDRESLLLAFQVSDIFSWDIDFATDLRRGDPYKLVVEGLYLDGEFRKYGHVLSAEFVNQGEVYRAYRFERDGKPDYYDESGKSLKKAFLKAPLNFRRISSGFSTGRYHPVLKIFRPHHGLDYAAPTGTPVSAVGDGTVWFAGWKGDYGKLVILKHPGGYKTYYGHLSRLTSGMNKGKHVAQGDVIGYVGSTGMTTGPHLHYEVRVNDRAVNPLSLKVPRKNAISERGLTEFMDARDRMNERLSLIRIPKSGFDRISEI